MASSEGTVFEISFMSKDGTHAYSYSIALPRHPSAKTWHRTMRNYSTNSASNYDRGVTVFRYVKGSCFMRATKGSPSAGAVPLYQVLHAVKRGVLNAGDQHIRATLSLRHAILSDES